MKWRIRARFVPSRNLPAPKVSGVIKAVTKLDETKPHNIVVSGSLFWCTVCGAFAESAPKLLGRGCRARHQGRWVSGGIPGQLKVLQSGRHPKTFESIQRPIELNVWLARDSDVGNLSTAITVWRGRGSEDWPIQGPPNLEDDGTALTQAQNSP